MSQSFMGLALNRDLVAANDRIKALQAEVNRFAQRNRQVMPLYKHAKSGLDLIFNEVTEVLPENENDTNVLGFSVLEYVVYAAKSDLVLIALRLYDGHVTVWDSQNRVKRVVEVSIDTTGELDDIELGEIDKLQRDIQWSRTARAVRVSGPVSLIGGQSATSTAEVEPAGTI